MPDLANAKPPFKPQGHQEVQGQEFGDGSWNFQIGFEGAGQHAKDKEKNGGIEKGVHAMAPFDGC